MRKVTILSALMMLTILASCGAKTDTTPLTSVESETSAPAQEAESVTIQEPVVLAQGFIEYDESVVGETENTVLFFHAEWCGSCKSAEADIIANGVPSDLTVLKVDFDDEKNLELRQKYGVTTKHTFVQVDANGDLVKKWEGSTGISDIQEEIESEDAMMKKDAESTTDLEDSDVMEKDGEVMQKDEAETGEVMEKKELSSGTYTNFDNSLVGNSEDTVIFFHAAWCPSCKAADNGISAGTVPGGLTILKADFDSSTELRKKYGVVAQHTFVQVDSDGNEIKKWVGGNSIDDIVERIQ